MTVDSSSPAAVRSGTATFRPDIQALRAIAVVAVVLFHLWPAIVPGGYVGVDVFFVISGFLIHSQLMAEVEKSGRVDLAQFWVRRLKRLQPAALLVLLATSLGIVLWVPRTFWIQFLQEIVASALWMQNWFLGFNSIDYLAAENNASPAQHYWTLSVEEQFYIGFPLILLGALLFARKSGASVRRTVAIAIGLVAIGSFAFSLWQTVATPSMAYFSTFTRAWQFALGALLSMWAVRPGRGAGAVAAAAGIAAIVLACVWFGADTAFPGYAALLPVVGAALCLWAGRGSWLEAVGNVRLVADLGRYSYAIYLWHWPLIVLAPHALGEDPGSIGRLAIAVLTFLLAKLSTEWVEDPIRFSPRLLGGTRRKRIVAGCAVAALALVLSSAVIPIHLEGARQRALEASHARLLEGPEAGAPSRPQPGPGSPRGVEAAAPAPSVDGLPSCFGAQRMDPRYAGCANPDLAGTLLPDPAVAKRDMGNRNDCWNLEQGSDRAKVCSLGPASGYRKRLYAFGDSHNNALIPVYEYMARRNNWRIDVSGHVGCYMTTARQRQPSLAHEESCMKWQASVLENAKAGYDGFIVTYATTIRPVIPADGQSEQQTTVEGLVAAWNRLPDVPILAIRDNPGANGDVIDCVAREGLGGATACSRKRGDALAFDAQVDAAARVARAHVIDLSDYYCTKTECPPVIGNVLVYRDRNHVSATYARTLAPYFNERIVGVIGE